MTVELLEKRQAIISWRDETVLGIWRIANRAAIQAKQEVEDHLAEAGLVDSLWDPDKFTRAKVDGVMQAALLRDLEGHFANAASQLSTIDPAYSPLANAFIESLAILKQPTPDTVEDSKGEESEGISKAQPRSGRIAAMMASLSNQEIIQSAKEWGSWALERVGEASDAASQKLQSGTGLHDRIRRSVQLRLDTVWMGGGGDRPSLVSELIEVAENVSNEARSREL